MHQRCHWHRWQIEKIFKQKNVNYFVWTPLGSRLYKFLPSSHFKMSAAWYRSHCLPSVLLTPVANLLPVSLIPVANCHRRCWHRWQICRRYRWHLTTQAKLLEKFAPGVVDTVGKFDAGAVDTGGKFATGVVDTGGTPWLANISANFQKIWNIPNGILWGWGETD